MGNTNLNTEHSEEFDPTVHVEPDTGQSNVPDAALASFDSDDEEKSSTDSTPSLFDELDHFFDSEEKLSESVKVKLDISDQDEEEKLELFRQVFLRLQNQVKQNQVNQELVSNTYHAQALCSHLCLNPKIELCLTNKTKYIDNLKNNLHTEQIKRLLQSKALYNHRNPPRDKKDEGTDRPIIRENKTQFVSTPKPHRKGEMSKSALIACLIGTFGGIALTLEIALHASKIKAAAIIVAKSCIKVGIMLTPFHPPIGIAIIAGGLAVASLLALAACIAGIALHCSKNKAYNQPFSEHKPNITLSSTPIKSSSERPPPKKGILKNKQPTEETKCE